MSVHLLCTRQGEAFCTPNSCPTGRSSPKFKLTLLQTLPPTVHNAPGQTASVLPAGPSASAQPSDVRCLGLFAHHSTHPPGQPQPPVAPAARMTPLAPSL